MIGYEGGEELNIYQLIQAEEEEGHTMLWMIPLEKHQTSNSLSMACSVTFLRLTAWQCLQTIMALNLHSGNLWYFL